MKIINRLSDAKIFSAQLDDKLICLDLHGFYPSEALEKLELFLYQCYQKKETVARIIYGGGTGVLKEKVLEYLKNHPLIDSIKDEGGACIVILETGK